MMRPQTHLQIVNKNFKRPRGRQFVPPMEAGATRQLKCLDGLGPMDWKELCVDDRRVQLRIHFNHATQEYTAAAFQNGELLEIWMKKECSRNEITMWFDRVTGPIARVPWAKIKEGQPWSWEVVFCDLYFQQRDERKRAERMRRENAKRLMLEMLG